MTVLRLIADDLTGALDSAARFTASLGPIAVHLDPAPKRTSGSFGLDLGCRDGTEAEAVARIGAAARHFQGADIAFKKMDSLLRGHWPAELAWLATSGSFRRIIVAPAFPDQGRVTRGGRQIVVGADGAETLVSVDPAVELSRRGLEVSSVADGDLGAAGAGIFLCDAASGSDLARIVRTARALAGSTLWCGAAGLAGALGGNEGAPTINPTAGSHLVVIGSNHPVTHGQVAFLQARTPTPIVRFDGDSKTSAERINNTLGTSGACLCIADLMPGCGVAEAKDLIARWLVAMMPLIDEPANLTVVGGETFAATCHALHIDMLLVEGEVSPGLPASSPANGQWRSTHCFSKSGAFGEINCLHRLIGNRS